MEGGEHWGMGGRLCAALVPPAAEVPEGSPFAAGALGAARVPEARAGGPGRSGGPGAGPGACRLRCPAERAERGGEFFEQGMLADGLG